MKTYLLMGFLALFQTSAYAGPKVKPIQCIGTLKYSINMMNGLVVWKFQDVTKPDLKRITDLLANKEFIKGNEIRSISDIKFTKVKKEFKCQPETQKPRSDAAPAVKKTR